MELTTAELFKVIVIGIIEGVTEWLPISSTGHMILVDELITLQVSQKFKDMLLVVIQLGAILSVVAMNFTKLNPWAVGKNRHEKNETIVLWYKVIVATAPAGVIGLLFDEYVEKHFMTAAVVAVTLIVYGVLFIIVENYNKGRKPRVTSLGALDYKTAVLIGCFQVLSLIPGTSRSGATILGGMLCGVSRTVVTEFTFFLAIPVMFGASLLKLLKFGVSYSLAELVILFVGMVVAFIISVLSIKCLLKYIKKNDFKAFGYYRIILGVVVLFCLVL